MLCAAAYARRWPIQAMPRGTVTASPTKTQDFQKGGAKAGSYVELAASAFSSPHPPARPIFWCDREGIMPQPAPRLARTRILSFLDSGYACKGVDRLAVATDAATAQPLHKTAASLQSLYTARAESWRRHWPELLGSGGLAGNIVRPAIEAAASHALPNRD